MDLFNRKKIELLEARIKHLETTAKVDKKRIWKLENPPKYKKGDKVWIYAGKYKRAVVSKVDFAEHKTDMYVSYLGYLQYLYESSLSPIKSEYHWEVTVVLDCKDIRVRSQSEVYAKKPKS